MDSVILRRFVLRQRWFVAKNSHFSSENVHLRGSKARLRAQKCRAFGLARANGCVRNSLIDRVGDDAARFFVTQRVARSGRHGGGSPEATLRDAAR